MNKYATNSRGVHVFIWIVCFVILCVAMVPMSRERIPMSDNPVLGVVCHDRRKLGFLFPWQRGERVKKWALHRYQVMRARYREARIKLRAVTSMAQVVDLLTRSQLRYQLGALPVLYVLLESLQVRQSINRHCPAQADVDHGTVALVLVLNRLLLPLPLVQISDWVGQTVLAAQLNIPAAKFNDDRLGRTLDALYPHLDVLWQELVAIALVKAQMEKLAHWLRRHGHDDLAISPSICIRTSASLPCSSSTWWPCCSTICCRDRFGNRRYR